MRQLLLSTALALMPGISLAEGIALVLGIERYEELDRVNRGARSIRASEGIANLGLTVIALPNGRADTTAAALYDFADAAVLDPERIIVALTGRFATDGVRTWLLTAEASDPGLLTLGATAVSVDSLLTVLAAAPGQALLMLGVEPGNEAYDPWLRQGIGNLQIPAGVTVLTGSPRDVADFVDDELSQPAGDLTALVENNGNLTITGFAPRQLILMPGAAGTPVAPPPPPVPDTAAEDALWQGAVALDSIAAYRNYLSRYPLGRYASQAEEAIAAILAEPNREARLLEEALNLTRDQRREIQRDLSTLDFDPRGIDGIFGNGTRRAIANWQQQNGYPQTTYLTREQISRLDAQAARRAAEAAAEAARRAAAAEAEAARQQAEAARLDRVYWEETGARGNEPGLRAYLERYPRGQFAALATDQLREIEAARQSRAEAEDRAAWQDARARDSVDAYRFYLQAYPRGAFVAQAQTRIAELSTPAPMPEPIPLESEEDDASARARAVEQALNLNRLTSQLIESRLDQMGMNPGAVDGEFDEQTRRAIRRFQESGGAPATGYVDERTLVMLLAQTFQ